MTIKYKRIGRTIPEEMKDGYNSASSSQIITVCVLASAIIVSIVNIFMKDPEIAMEIGWINLLAIAFGGIMQLSIYLYYSKPIYEKWELKKK